MASISRGGNKAPYQSQIECSWYATKLYPALKHHEERNKKRAFFNQLKKVFFNKWNAPRLVSRTG